MPADHDRLAGQCRVAQKLRGRIAGILDQVDHTGVRKNQSGSRVTTFPAQHMCACQASVLDWLADGDAGFLLSGQVCAPVARRGRGPRLLAWGLALRNPAPALLYRSHVRRPRSVMWAPGSGFASMAARPGCWDGIRWSWSMERGLIPFPDSHGQCLEAPVGAFLLGPRCPGQFPGAERGGLRMRPWVVSGAMQRPFFVADGRTCSDGGACRPPGDGWHWRSRSNWVQC